MAWTRQQLMQHLAAARLLDHIRQGTWQFLRSHRQSTEFAAQQFMRRQFRRHHVVSRPPGPIVAFREHTAEVHYFPPRVGSLRLRPGSWILLDLWARLAQPGAPYADITWMAWYGGRVPPALQRIFTVVRQARNASVEFFQRQLQANTIPSGRAVDAVARRMIDRAGFRQKFLHGLGHSLGLSGPHGEQGALAPKNSRPLTLGIGYTIEPGVYLAGKYGARLEMDGWIGRDRQLMVTTEMQREIVRINPSGVMP